MALYLTYIVFVHVGWLLSKDIKKLVLVVLSAESRVVRERWEFDVVLMEPEVTEEEGSVCVLTFISFPRFHWNFRCDTGLLTMFIVCLSLLPILLSHLVKSAPFFPLDRTLVLPESNERLLQSS